MPEKEPSERAQEDLREGKSPTTAAGEFVREEFHHVREGKHGARSPEQAIAIGLSKARRAGVPLKPPSPEKAEAETVESAERDYRKGQRRRKTRPSPTRSRAIRRALKREGRSAAAPSAVARQTRRAAQRRGALSRRQAARKAVRTKGRTGLKRAAQKAARSRQRRIA